ncbi:unnamed protein product [Mesocestoides corti]|uniref:AB hydrolase-1 domain-containing protein n=1 Tax=Mesocestoides corti TaxID=53468 RepID=A0A0R3U642_MESCO|nr:unnamed protein product [Mesocestoides corti]
MTKCLEIWPKRGLSTVSRGTDVSLSYGAFSNVLSHRLHYVRIGHGKINLLLLPGPMGSVSTDYSEFLRMFDQSKFTAVALNPVGCGNSVPPYRDWSDPGVLEQDGDLGVQLMRQINLTPFIFIGWSTGAHAALCATVNTASEGTEPIKGLVIWSLHDDPPANHAWTLGMEATYGRSYFRKCWHDYVIAKTKGQLRTIRSGQVAESLRYTPILYIRSTGEPTSRLLNALRSCPLYVERDWPESNGSPHKEHPDLFREIVEEFASNLPL